VQYLDSVEAVGDQSATTGIRLARKQTYADKWRTYQVFIDDERTGSIREGQSRTFEVQPGRHHVYLRINWCRSPRVAVDCMVGEPVMFVCQGQHNPIKALFAALFAVDQYIELRQEP